MDEANEIKIAVLNPDAAKTGRSSFEFYNPSEFKKPVDGVQGFKYVSADDETDDYARLVDSNHQAWVFLSEFFTWKPGDIRPYAICETAGSGEDTFITPFISAGIGLHRHMVFARGSKHLLAHPKAIQNVRFVTGLCLFSDKKLQAIGQDGEFINLLNPRESIDKHIEKIINDDNLSFYELEGSMRLARLIADLSLNLPRNLPAEIVLDIPHVQYYVYLLDAYQRNLLSKELLLHWFELVQIRHDVLVSRMRGQMDKWFENASIPVPLMKVSGGLTQLREYITTNVTAGKVILPEDMAGILEVSDNEWRLLNKISPPKTFLDIVYNSYSLEQLRGNLHNQDGAASQLLTIAVDNREEQRIYQSSLKLLAKIRATLQHDMSPLLGIYSLENFLVANQQKWGLYFHDPGDIFIDSSGQPYSIDDMLNQSYGGSAQILPITTGYSRT